MPLLATLLPELQHIPLLNQFFLKKKAENGATYLPGFVG